MNVWWTKDKRTREDCSRQLTIVLFVQHSLPFDARARRERKVRRRDTLPPWSKPKRDMAPSLLACSRLSQVPSTTCHRGSRHVLRTSCRPETHCLDNRTVDRAVVGLEIPQTRFCSCVFVGHSLHPSVGAASRRKVRCVLTSNRESNTGVL
jgi:hypothetical protein